LRIFDLIGFFGILGIRILVDYAPIYLIFLSFRNRYFSDTLYTRTSIAWVKVNQTDRLGGCWILTVRRRKTRNPNQHFRCRTASGRWTEMR